MKNNKINPIGLKGAEVNQRMIELMGIKPIVENKSTSVVELTKVGPDNRVYAIVRENHEYYIKVTNKQTNLISEDFNYIGGLQNKKSEAYPSYAKAIKHLNLNFKSLAEAHGKGGDINVFKNDNLIKEDWGTEPYYGEVGSDGDDDRWDKDDADEKESDDVEDDVNEAIDAILGKKEKKEDEVELTEMEKLIDNMLKEDDEDEVKEENIYESKMTISKGIENFDAIIESLNLGKKKV